MSRREDDAKYDASPKGQLRIRRANLFRKRKAGPAGSPGEIGAAAQRERRLRPEYVLARRLGISVKVAREMIE